MTMTKIVLTAGHSNKDPGAVHNGLSEAALAARLRNILALKLLALGFDVVTDGEGEVNGDLNHAINLIKTHKPAVALEIHFNAANNPTATGVETISLPKDKVLAQALSKAVANVLEDKLRGDAGWIDQTSSARGKLGYVSAGGLIAEIAFISNQADMDEYQEKYFLVASAMADVIAKTVQP